MHLSSAPYISPSVMFWIGVGARRKKGRDWDDSSKDGADVILCVSYMTAEGTMRVRSTHSCLGCQDVLLILLRKRDKKSEPLST